MSFISLSSFNIYHALDFHFLLVISFSPSLVSVITKDHIHKLMNLLQGLDQAFLQNNLLDKIQEIIILLMM
jgi:hypothetical protein